LFHEDEFWMRERARESARERESERVRERARESKSEREREREREAHHVGGGLLHARRLHAGRLLHAAAAAAAA